MIRALLTAILLMLSGVATQAHPLQPGYLELTVLGPDQWRALWKVPAVNEAPLDITAVLPAACDTPRPPAPHFDGIAWVSAWQVHCPGGLANGQLTIDGLAATSTDVLVRYELAPGQSATARLTPTDTTLTFPDQPQGAGLFVTYVRLGIDHILGGTDHLMFVFALLLLIPDTRRLIGAVTAFTVAHSMSLVAATLGWIIVPAAPVEAVIALSIMFLAAELARPPGQNLRLSERYPWAVSFSFGLLHGLGFARALLDIGLPPDDVPLSLFAFNVGVEIGQLLFIAAVLGLAWLGRRVIPALMAWLTRPGGWGRWGAAYGIGSAAAIWFIGRLAVF